LKENVLFFLVVMLKMYGAKKKRINALQPFLRHCWYAGFEMCAGVPTIEMKIYRGLLVRHNTRLCRIQTMLSNVPSADFSLQSISIPPQGEKSAEGEGLG
jgi:hypothetical protein